VPVTSPSTSSSNARLEFLDDVSADLAQIGWPRFDREAAARRARVKSSSCVIMRCMRWPPRMMIRASPRRFGSARRAEAARRLP
jgi:hypothetical protein